MRTLALAVASVLALVPATAAAQTVTPTAERISMATADSGGSIRSNAEEWMIDPRITAEVGAELRFLTSRVGLGDRALRFTDVGIASASVRHAFGARAEVAASLDLLAKQPAWLDEPVVQGVQLATRVALAPHWVGWARLGGAPLLGGRGLLGQGSVGLEARSRLDRTFAFQGLAGVANSALRLDGGERANLTELVAGGMALLRAPHGEGAMWLGADYRVPLGHRDAPSLPLDPQTRLGFTAGGMLGWIDDWDLYALVAVTDRGDPDMPETTLPVLDGGFDQVSIVFGAVRRWERDEISDAARELAY